MWSLSEAFMFRRLVSKGYLDEWAQYDWVKFKSKKKLCPSQKVYFSSRISEQILCLLPTYFSEQLFADGQCPPLTTPSDTVTWDRIVPPFGVHKAALAVFINDKEAITSCKHATKINALFQDTVFKWDTVAVKLQEKVWSSLKEPSTNDPNL